MGTGEQPILPPIYNIDNIINKYKEIPLGEYNNGKISLKKEFVNEDIKRVEIKNNDIYFLIRLFTFGYDISYRNNKIMNSTNCLYTLNIVKSLGCSKEFIDAFDNEVGYKIYKDFVRVNGVDLKIYGNTIRKNLSKKYFLEYDFIENKMYVYISKKEQPNFKMDYIKFEYCKELIDTIKMINDKNRENYYNLSDLLLDSKYSELSQLLNYKKIKCDFEKEGVDLIRAADMYVKYKDKFEIENNVLEEIGTFVNYLLENPIEARVNKLENYISKCDMNDSRELKYLKKEIIDILKEKNKVKTKKLNNK